MKDLQKSEVLFDVAGLEQQLKELEDQTTNPEFWNDSANSGKILKQINNIKSKTENYKKIKENLQYILELNDLVYEEIKEMPAGAELLKSSFLLDGEQENIKKDSDLYAEIKEVLEETESLENNIEKLEISTLLSGKYDSNNAILTIHPGAGGTEAQDWAEMLYRMYTRWASQNGYDVKELDYLDGEEAGLKSVTFLVSGEYAYGYLKGEMGVHRLVRISPFDAGGRR